MRERATASTGSLLALNLALVLAVVAAAAALVFVVPLALDGGGDDVIDGAAVSSGAGEDVGPGVVEAVPLAPESEQRRTAEQLDAAKAMVQAFVNFDYTDSSRTIEEVRKRSTGTFLEQYSKGAADLRKLAQEAQSQMTARVVWAGLVIGDEDSATVIVATSGSVKNKTTDFREEARNYRIQVELERKGDAWLTNDLQYVTLG